MHPVFAQYEERLLRLNRSASTLKNFRRTVVLFEAAGLAPGQAQDFQIEEWLAGLPHAVRTKKLHLENLCAAYRYAVRRGTLASDPTEYVELERVPDKEPTIITTSELRAIRARCDTGERRRMFHLLAYTGMRRGELYGLKWGDVRSDSLCIRAGKGGKLRHVPVHPTLAEHLSQDGFPQDFVFPNRRGEQLSVAAIHYRIHKIAPNHSYHDFRRTVATSLAENDVSPYIIDRILGWASRTVGSRYYIRGSDKKTQEAILKLYSDDPL